MRRDRQKTLGSWPVSARRWLSLCIVWLLVAGTLCGQEKPPAGQDKKGDDVAAERAAPRGRLPVYFSRVVDRTQREEIYAIQARYSDQIEKLQEQIDALVKERDAEVDAVLTPEQMKQVEQFRDAAKQRRSAAGKDGSGDPDKSGQK